MIPNDIGSIISSDLDHIPSDIPFFNEDGPESSGPKSTATTTEGSVGSSGGGSLGSFSIQAPSATGAANRLFAGRRASNMFDNDAISGFPKLVICIIVIVIGLAAFL